MADKPGTVFIAEDFDDEDRWMWPARFSVHWEQQDGSGFVDGPEGVSLEEALAWGRQRSDVVLLRLGDSDTYYSAGARRLGAPGDEDIAPWPQDATVRRRRHPGMEHLDISADEPIPWTVRLPRQLPAEGFEQHARRLADALAADDAVSQVSVESGQQPFEAVFRFSVLARTHAEAFTQFLALDDRTWQAAPPAVDGVPLPDEGTYFVGTGLDPYNDIRPAAE